MKYITIIKVGIRNKLIYNWSILFDLVLALIATLIPIFLWRAVYSNYENISSFLSNYSIIAQIVSVIYVFESSDKLPGKITSGLISYELIRPMNYITRLFFEDLGAIIVKVFTLAVPMFICAKFIFGFHVPSVPILIFFAVNLLLSIIILYFVRIIISMFSFWVFETWSFLILLDVLMVFLSGRFMPDYMMPELIKKVMVFMPFVWVFQRPMEIYLSTYRDDFINVELFVYTVLIQLLWILVLFTAQYFLWRVATKRLVVQGG